MYRHLVLCFLLIGSCVLSSYAQDVEGDEFILKHLKTNVYSLDSEASAVVLYENGSVDVGVVGDMYQQVFRIHRIIKIITADAIDEANIEKYFTTRGLLGGKASKIKGITYNLSGDNVIKTPLESSSIFIIKQNENVNKLSFTLPAVKEGSVIDYSYEIITGFYTKQDAWYFQDKYPVLQSEYEISFPKTIPFIYLTQGNIKFTKYDFKSQVRKVNPPAYFISTTEISDNTNYCLWGRKNIPPIKEEPYSGNTEDYAEKVEVQLQSLDNSVSKLDSIGLRKAWVDFTDKIWERNKFGKQITGENSFLSPVIDSLTSLFKDDDDKARAIFNYVRNNVYCSDKVALNANKELKKVFQNREGNAAEVNSLLCAMLRKAGLDASPVLLSIYGQPKTDKDYPILDRYNNRVCVLNLQVRQIMLDASDKYNAYGWLPSYCYNGYAWEVNEHGGEAILLDSKKNKERTNYNLHIEQFTDSNLTIQVTELLGMNTSREFRKSFAEDRDKIPAFVKTALNKDVGDVSDIECEGISNTDTNIVLKFKVTKKYKLNTLYFYTDQVKMFDKNPYAAMKRTMPVERNYQQETLYTLNGYLPAGVEPEEIFKPVMLSFDNNRISFKHLINYDQESRYFSVVTHYKSVETFFMPMEYDILRQFNDKMLNEINKVVVFKFK